MAEKSLKGTKTEQNLWEAFAGESMARNKYTYFASKAKKEGYEQISAIFTETAGNEKEHAELWFKALGGIGDTKANLLAAAEGEHEEWTAMYKRMKEEAESEGFDKIAGMFQEVLEVEEQHEKRYRRLLDRVENGTVFKEEEPILWHCRNCGYIYEGAEAPDKCPCCDHPKAYFERFAENY